MEPALPQPDPVLPPNVRPAPPGGPSRPARVARLLALRALRWPYLAGRALWPRRLSLTVIVALLALSGWLAAQLYLPGARVTLRGAPAAQAGPAAAEAFLDGQEQFDAEAMWATLSPDAQQQFAASGESPVTWQARAQLEQRAGLRYAGHTFVGASALPDGGSIAFYLEQVEAAGQHKVEIVSLAFRLDPNGKILRIGHVS